MKTYKIYYFDSEMPVGCHIVLAKSGLEAQQEFVKNFPKSRIVEVNYFEDLK